jgi:hypothetical protein
MTGIDFEPNSSSDSITNFVISNVNTYNNQGGGTSFGLFNLGPSARVSITANGLVSTNDKQGGIGFFNSNKSPGNDASGSIVCNSCKVINSEFAGTYGRRSIGGWQMIFNDLVITNPNRNGADRHYGVNSAIGVAVAGGSTGQPGGVIWNNVSITGGNGCFDVGGAQGTTISGTCNGKAIKYP